MATTKWTLDPVHSEVNFKVKHMMISTVRGNFSAFDVTAETTEDDFKNAAINFSADASSVSTGNEQRDGHLKSGDFFDVENFPKITFESNELRKSSDKGDYVLAGNLTIKDTTKPVELEVEFGGINKDPWGNIKAGFTVETKINRKEFGLTWNAALETGGVLVSDDVSIVAEIQMVKSAS